MNTAVRVQQVSWDTARTHLIRIRTRVFIEEQQVPPELEWDEHDNHCIHLLAIADDTDATEDEDNNDRVIGTARMLADGHIGRMAVMPEWRNQNVGSKLLGTLLRIAQQQQFSQVFLFAQTSAIDFYRKHNFTITSDEFMDAGIAHREMKLTFQDPQVS